MWVSRANWEERSQALIRLEVKLQVTEQMLESLKRLLEIAERDAQRFKEELKLSDQRVAKLERALLKMQDMLNAKKTQEVQQPQRVVISVDEDLEEDPALVEQYRDLIRKSGTSDGLLAAEASSGVPHE